LRLVFGLPYSASMPILHINVPTRLRPIAMPSLFSMRINMRAGKWMLQIQLVDPAHERQICGTDRARRVVRTGSANAEQLDLPDNRQGVGTINHFFYMNVPICARVSSI
jgi:hypothetical protein